FLEIKDKDPNFQFMSRLYIYYNERSIEGTVKTDSGAMIKDGIKSLNKLGVCPESEWQYNENAFTVKPNAQCYIDAIPNKIVSYYKVNDMNDVKAVLCSGYPVVFG